MTNKNDYSVEDDKETQDVIGSQADSEFKRLIERLKKEAELAANKDVKGN